MKNAYKLMVISYILFSLILFKNSSAAETKKDETPPLNQYQFSQLLSEIKKLTGQYILNCNDDQARESAGWLNEDACLQDGRSHKVYEHSDQGHPTNGFDKADLEKLSKAAQSGAEISVQEKPHDTTYICAAFDVKHEESQPPVVTCNSHKFSWPYHPKKGSTREFWFHTASDGQRIHRHINANGVLGYSEAKLPLAWFIRY